MLLQKLHLARISDEVQSSPLLTNEDLQLLQAATSAPFHSAPDSAHNHTRSFLLVLLPIVVAVVWALHPYASVVGVAILLLFFGSGYLIRRWFEHVLSRAHITRAAYYSGMDKFLTQLMLTIRWLQEMEIVSRGLTRPLPSLPASRLDQCHTHKLLRRRVLCTCGEVVCALRAATRELCGVGGVRLAEELEDRGSYLAFSNLQELHPHMSEGRKEAAVDTEALSLQSIKVIT